MNARHYTIARHRRQTPTVRRALISDEIEEGACLQIAIGAMPKREGVRKSRVVLSLTPGNIATAPRSDMMTS